MEAKKILNQMNPAHDPLEAIFKMFFVFKHFILTLKKLKLPEIN